MPAVRPRIKPAGSIRLRYFRKPRRRAVYGAVIYFIQAGVDGPIKIGITLDVHKRLAQLQHTHYAELRLLRSIKGTDAQEKKLHRAFADVWIRGEWFRPDKRLLSFAEQVRDFLGEELPMENAAQGALTQPISVKANGFAKKLTPDAIRYIRRSAKTEVELSIQFGVSRSMVGSIRRKQRWEHVL